MAYLAMYVALCLAAAGVGFHLGHLPTAVLLAISALVAAAFWIWGLRQNQQAMKFLKWLQANRHHVEANSR